MKSDQFKLVVFDLDGTLYPQKQIKRKIIRSFLLNLKTLSQYNKARKKLIGSKWASFDELLNQTAKLMNPDNPKKAKDWIQNKFYHNFLSGFSNISSQKIVVDSLNFLKEKNVKIAVVSDYGEVLYRLKQLGFKDDFFDFTWGTESDGLLKPNLLVAKRIEEKFDLFGNDILFVGDRSDTDQKLALDNNSQFFGISFGEENEEFQSWEQFYNFISAKLK